MGKRKHKGNVVRNRQAPARFFPSFLAPLNASYLLHGSYPCSTRLCSKYPACSAPTAKGSRRQYPWLRDTALGRCLVGQCGERGPLLASVPIAVHWIKRHKIKLFDYKVRKEKQNVLRGSKRALRRRLDLQQLAWAPCWLLLSIRPLNVRRLYAETDRTASSFHLRLQFRRCVWNYTVIEDNQCDIRLQEYHSVSLTRLISS